MRAQEKILDALSRSPLCDDCLSVQCGIHPRQQVNQRCAYLFEVGHITRERESCPNCRSLKLVNHVKLDALEKIRSRRPIAVEIDTEKFKSAIDKGVEDGNVIVCHQLPTSPWYWEGNVQGRIVEYLIREGFQLTRAAKTDTRETGKDIEAQSASGKKLWLTVKGYPEKSVHTQARHWFAECLFDLILYHEEDNGAELGIGLPDGYATYRNLAKRIKWFKSAVGFRFYWVHEDGTVRVE